MGNGAALITFLVRGFFPLFPHFTFLSHPYFLPVCSSRKGDKGFSMPKPRGPSKSAESPFIIPKINTKAAEVNNREAKL